MVHKKRRLLNQKRNVRTLILTATLFGALAGMGRADAAIPPALRPSTQPGFFQFEMGPAVSLHDHVNQFKMAFAGGYHLFGGGDGPALGASMQFGFGHDVFGFQMGPRFWWDIPVVPGLGLYLTPVAQLGYAVVSNSHTWHFLNVQFGFEPRLVINNRGLVYFRFFTIDMFFGEEVAARYDMMFGGGLTF